MAQACLTFCEDETLVSFVKAGFKVRACFQSFREGWNALNERDWEAAPHDYKGDFESGVRLGIGSFNLLISLLPARIMRLLEFIGFQGNRVSWGQIFPPVVVAVVGMGFLHGVSISEFPC